MKNGNSWKTISFKLESSEKDMETKLFTLDELKKMIKNGVIKDSPTVASFGLYNEYNNS